jgi:DNA-binding transcriptional regulator YiaG
MRRNVSSANTRTGSGEEDAMRCKRCDGPLRINRMDYSYTESGLENVVLAKAPVYVCPDHGVQELAIGGVHALHAQIARAILDRRPPLTGPEIRFLRKYHRWNQTKLADLLGVTRVTVSNWERESTPLSTANQERCFILFKNPRVFATLRASEPPVAKRAASIRIPLSPMSARSVPRPRAA